MRRWAPVLLAGVLTLAAAPAGARQRPDAEVTYEVFAVRYATLPGYRLAGLVEGADPEVRLDLAMMVWLLKGSDGRSVLFDAGFGPRDDLMQRWHPLEYRTPAEAVAAFGVAPEEVDDVVISHVHWDHFDGADLFPNARVWLQREESEHHVGAGGQVLDRTIDGPDAAKLQRLRDEGRLRLVEGDAAEPIPGITAYTGGKHTFQSQYVGVRTAGGTVILASDNVYLYENLDRALPIAQTLDAASNLAAQRRMRVLAAEPRLIVPGHDPAVFERFEVVAPGVVRIR